MPIVVRSASKSRRRETIISSAIVPLESAEDFGAVLEELFRDLKPAGVLEEDAVHTAAKLIWRKHRLAIFHFAQDAEEQLSNRLARERWRKALKVLPYGLHHDPVLHEENQQSAEQSEQQAVLLTLRGRRVIRDLEVMQELDRGITRTLDRLKKLQEQRFAECRSMAGNRAPRWRRMQQ